MPRPLYFALVQLCDKSLAARARATYASQRTKPAKEFAEDHLVGQNARLAASGFIFIGEEPAILQFSIGANPVIGDIEFVVETFADFGIAAEPVLESVHILEPSFP